MFCTVGPEKSFIPKLAKILHTNGVEHVELGLVKKLYIEVDLVKGTTGNANEVRGWNFKMNFLRQKPKFLQIRTYSLLLRFVA